MSKHPKRAAPEFPHLPKDTHLILNRHIYAMQAPEFRCELPAAWPKIRAKYNESLARIATLTGVTLVLFETRDRSDRHLHSLRCRICHAGTTWWISALRKCSVGAKVTLLDHTGRRTIDPRTFDFLQIPGVVRGPRPSE